MTTPADGPYESCTLPAADLPGRLAEFDAAFAAGLRHAEVISPTHARLVFTADQAGRRRWPGCSAGRASAARSSPSASRSRGTR